MSYIVIFIIAICIGVLMYIQNVNATNRDLKRQKQNLQTKIVQEKVKSNIKEFQAYQKAKKEQIKKDTEDETKNNDINLNVGTHALNF